MAELRIGTCSWKYDSWRGLVYPEKGAFDFLKEYSRRFDTVEIDQWFWSLFAGDRIVLPKQDDVRHYAAAVTYPANWYDNAILKVRPTSGTGQVVCFGASANNASNDPAAHLAVQGEWSFQFKPEKTKNVYLKNTFLLLNLP
jgi:hypothetical protein